MGKIVFKHKTVFSAAEQTSFELSKIKIEVATRKDRLPTRLYFLEKNWEKFEVSTAKDGFSSTTLQDITDKLKQLRSK